MVTTWTQYLGDRAPLNATCSPLRKTIVNTIGLKLYQSAKTSSQLFVAAEVSMVFGLGEGEGKGMGCERGVGGVRWG